MSKVTITLIDDTQARELAQAAYTRTAEACADDPVYRYTAAYHAAEQAVFAAYPTDTFCVAREKPIHKAIRKQAREAANAAVAVPS